MKRIESRDDSVLLLVVEGTVSNRQTTINVEEHLTVFCISEHKSIA